MTTPTTLTTTEILNDNGDVVTVSAVRLWNVYEQGWRVYPVTSVPDAVLASLPVEEREMIASVA